MSAERKNSITRKESIFQTVVAFFENLTLRKMSIRRKIVAFNLNQLTLGKQGTYTLQIT